MDPNASSLGSSASDGDTFTEEGGDAEGMEQQKALIARLDAMGQSLARKRQEAIQAREQSGIEAVWLEDIEHYEGIDDANRDQHRSAWQTKPPGQLAQKAIGGPRSTVFPNITRPYCDAAAARIADMLLPTDDRSWGLKPTPIPDLVGISEGKIPPDIQKQLQAPPGPGMPPPDAGQVAKAGDALVEQAKRELDEAKDKAARAEKRIEDWAVECQWHAEVRKVIEDAAQCGAGVLKGPFPIKRRVVALMDIGADGQQQEGKPNILERLVNGIKRMMGREENKLGKALIVKEEIKPASKRIDFWNLYPDGACGDNIHAGSYIWERDYLTARQLMDLIGSPGYIESQLKAVLEEGPMKAIAMVKNEPEKFLVPAEDRRYEIWYFHGNVDREDLKAGGCECDEDSNPQIPAMIAMINTRVVKAAMNPLDEGSFPYDIFPWQRKSGSPWGTGVSRQGRTPQKIVTAGVRHMMDNGGLSAGPQIVMKQGALIPADGNMSLGPRKIWWWGPAIGDDIDDVRKAMTFFNIPSMQQELEAIVQFGLRLMEDSTGLPMLLQGQLGKAPDTVGGMTMLNNNASAVLRRLARTFDDAITEPHLRRYYNWLLQHGEDDDEKGDFMIDARGSSALVERDMQSQQIPELLKASANPLYGIDPKKAMLEYLKSLKFDTKNFEYEDEEWKKIVEQMGQKPQDPRLEVTQMQLADKEKQRQWEAAENDKERKNQIEIQLIDEQLTSADLSSSERLALEGIKARLAEVAMKLTTQKELASVSTATDIHKHHNPSPVIAPPVEPPGRAKPGRAYEQ